MTDLVTSLVAVCFCGHAELRHPEGYCERPRCDCVEFQTDDVALVIESEPVGGIALRDSRNAAPRSVSTHHESATAAPGLSLAKHPDGLKCCPHCDTDKPLAEFHVTDGSWDGLAGWCKQCMNTRAPGPQTKPRIIRNRARQRATAELLREHEHEFKALYAKHLREARVEAELLQSLPAAQAIYGQSEHVRLRPGRKAKGEQTTDRIDVARCPHCIHFHDAGHVCAKCGAAPAAGSLATGVAS